MTSQELKMKYADLYGYMANSKDPANMKAFGKVMTEMFMWFADNKPDAAQDWLDNLEAIKWKNYLTQKEADAIVAKMDPKAPWSREQWAAAMQQKGYPMESQPDYNRCALWVAMNMIMSDSSETIGKYIDSARKFEMVHDLAVDKLTDKDGVFNIRSYFGL